MKIDIKIPETLNDLTLKQWQNYIAIPEDSDNVFKMKRALSIFFGIREIDHRQIQASDVDHLFLSLTEVLKKDAEFENRFTLHGVEYGFIPNLENISFGEYIDLENYGEPELYHKAMSVLFRPIQRKQSGGRYRIARYKKSGDGLRDIPLGIALGAISFFLTLGEQLVNSILNSTPEVHAQMPKLNLVTNGAGILPSILSLWETLPSLNLYNE